MNDSSSDNKKELTISLTPSNQSRRTEVERSPELLRLLQELRPFQREAYDFATQGIVSTRQFSSVTTTTTTTSANHEINENKSPIVYNSDSKKFQGTNCNGRLLLADEQGLGKTVTSLAIMLHYSDEWPLLILCPASLRFTWPGEIEKFLPHLPPSAVYVVQGFDDADFYENESKRNRIQVVVATYSLLQKRSAAARTLQQFNFQCVIADESHYLKEKNSQRTQLALQLLQNAKRLLLLSGTPALARPVELWTQGRCLVLVLL
jgi:SNF2 family DNA or RNA helicase